MGYDILSQEKRKRWAEDLASFGLSVDAYAVLEFICRAKITSQHIGYKFDGSHFGQGSPNNPFSDLSFTGMDPTALLRQIQERIRIEEASRWG